MRRSRSALLLLAVLLAVGLSVAPPVVPATHAAAPELQITAAARYDVQPDRSRVQITLDTIVTNTHTDGPAVRTYYDTAFLAVLPGTTNFAVTSMGAKPTVSVRSQTPSYTLLSIKLGRRLYAGRHTPLRLRFDLPDRGGTAIRDVRVGPTLVAFPVWAFATANTPGSSVRVVFPAGYSIQLQVGSLRGPADGAAGSKVYASGQLSAPLAFYAYFIADRPGAFHQTRLTTTVAGTSVSVTVRAWNDDRPWGTRTASLVLRALPALSASIGLPYPGTALVVEESVSRTIGGYAGVFDPVAGTIQIAYYAGPFVVLHETAHVWLNGKMASDRWILEAFASWYASRAATSLKIAADPPALTPELRAAAIPLNAWPGVGRAAEVTEEYAYAATFQLARAIAARSGVIGLRDVWRAAAAGEYAYQPLHAGAAPERGARPPDWRGLLDLLEERTSARYADLWIRWVVRPTEAHLLAERAVARAAYASAAHEAGDWELPPGVRQAMSAWQFGQASALIAASRAVLAQRSAIAAAAAAAGLTVPPTLRAAFEGSGGPETAANEAAQELETIDVLVGAEAASHTADGLFARLGLLGLRPEADLAEGRSAFAAGDLVAARSHASTAESVWQTADGRGRQRLVSTTAAFVGLVLLLLAIVILVRTRRARREERWR